MNENLKDNPFIVPEGYFDGLRRRLAEIPSVQERVSLWSRARPYVVLAAAFLVMVTVGTVVLKQSVSTESLTEFEKYQYAGLIPMTAGYYLENNIEDEEEELTEEDLKEYLIYTGATVEHINYVCYEDVR